MSKIIYELNLLKGLKVLRVFNIVVLKKVLEGLRVRLGPVLIEEDNY
jgi:hypothetical protein